MRTSPAPSDKILLARRARCLRSLLRAVVDEAPRLGHLWSVASVSGHRQPGRTL